METIVKVVKEELQDEEDFFANSNEVNIIETILDAKTSAHSIINAEIQVSANYLATQRVEFKTEQNDYDDVEIKIEPLPFSTHPCENELLERCDDVDIKEEPLPSSSHHQKAVKATGGQTFKPHVSEVGTQMMAPISNRLQPRNNNCNSAAVYITNNEGDVTNEHDNAVDLTIEPIDESETVRSDQYIPPKTSEPTKTAVSKTRKKNMEIPLKRKKVARGTSTKMKRKFYERKLECALIEKQNKLLNYSVAKKLETLINVELKTKQLEFEKLNSNIN